MADIETYTATPCGTSGGPQYEVPVLQAVNVPFSNLGAVKVSTQPDTWKCCTIDRSTTNTTPEADTKDVIDSRYSVNDCPGCQAEWE